MSWRFPDAVDVIVVGGGAAGAATAIKCCQRGLRTLVLEPRTEAGDIPGETLHPAMEPMFRALGVDRAIAAAGFHRHRGYIVRSKGSTSTHYYGSDARGAWEGYQADRSRLHTILLEHAKACGAIVMRGERAVHPIFTGRRMTGIVSSAGRHGASFVVDASGHAHWLMRQLRIPVLEVSPRLIALFGWGVPDERGDRAPGLPEFALESTSWDWRAPIRTDRQAWVHMDLEPDLAKQRAIDGRSKCPAGLAPSGKTGARDVTWRIARPSAGPGYFLAGDAAWVLDPASSHGVLFAFMSAMAATDAIVEILRSPQDHDHVQARYSTWTEDWLSRDAAALISLYGAMDTPPNWLSSAADAIRYIAMSPSERAFSRRHS
jgi:flavin-dependent dehydrogenase